METHIDQTITTTTTKKKDKGFTLVELLIVIVILGILSTVTVFAVRGITTTGRTNACATDKRVLETAAEAYLAQNGGSTITTVAASTSTVGTTAEQTLQLGGFLKAQSNNYTVDTAGVVGPQPTPNAGNNCI